MKRIPVLLVLILCLCGCARTETSRIQITIPEGDGYTVEHNGQWVVPGEDAVFRIAPEPGLALGGTDYPGEVRTRIVDGYTELTVCQVRYPARIHLTLTEHFAQITYDPNGGEGTPTTVLYDRATHDRPNTSSGRDLFTREGYTLTGWNTAPDGSGQRIGLGSRVTAGPEGITLYAQWAQWNPATDFTFTDGVYWTVTGYHGDSDIIVIPATVDGKAVGAIAHNAFRDCDAEQIVLPDTMVQVAEGAFRNCGFSSVILFDSIENISNASFRDCAQLHTLYINASQPPFGYRYRKESVYADKADLLIRAAGQRKLVFYGGCSTWYNLDAGMAEETLGEQYEILNLGLNGTVNSAVQMQILEALLEPGDILFHTPELASPTQMMRKISMDRDDDKLWCGLENNYDLVSLVDFGAVPGLLESFCAYLEQKDETADYGETYTDSQGRTYLDRWGSIPFERTETAPMLTDRVSLDPDCIDDGAMERLAQMYQRFSEQGVRVYVGYACVNLDAVPEEERDQVQTVDDRFRQAVEAMDGPVLISRLEDYLYHNEDFYDTNYHLRSDRASANTALWLRDLTAQLEQDAAEERP